MNGWIAVSAIGATLALAVSPAASDVHVTIESSFTGRTLDEAVPSQPWGLPPDTIGAVGDDHVVELLNAGYAVYDKDTGELLESDSLAGFWESAGASPKDGVAWDPKGLYDHASRRFFATSLDSLETHDLMIAVSNTSDPTQGWSGFRLDIDPTDEHKLDYPQIGVDAEGVYITAVYESKALEQQVATLVVVLPKSDLLAPLPSIANATVLIRDVFNDVGASPHPAINLDGGAGAVPMLSGGEVVAGLLAASRIGGTVEAPVIEDQTYISVPPVPRGTPRPPQPGPKPGLTRGRPLTAPGFALQEGVLWAVQRDFIDGRDAVRWYKIDPETFEILQMGNITDDELHLFYPSLAVNDDGRVVIGFSGSSESQYVSAYAVVGETVSDTTVFGDLILLREGVSDYEVLDRWGNNRWGDFSATVLDPVDPDSFWTFQLYVHDTDVWGVQMTEIRVATLIHADVDIKPGSDRNPISPISRGVIPVAILGSSELDVSNIDRATLAFGPSGASPAHRKGGHIGDVDGDGHDDLVSHYRTRETGVAFGDEEACVTAETFGGAVVEGCDSIRVWMVCGHGSELAFLFPPLIWLRARRRAAPKNEAKGST